jgi:hypothetical protein
LLKTRPATPVPPAEQFVEKLKSGRLDGLKAASPKLLRRTYAAHLKVWLFKTNRYRVFQQTVKPTPNKKKGGLRRWP